jgi:hypothetical protein
VEALGYGHLITQHGLAARPLPITRLLVEQAAVRRVRQRGGETLEEFPRQYRPEPTVLGHLQFALRYEGLNLEVLQLLFDRIGSQEIEGALQREPTNVTWRRLAYLFEWLMGADLPVPSKLASSKRAYATVLDEKLQYGLLPSAGIRIPKFKLIDNLPGTPAFCPLVRRVPYLEAMASKDLKERTRATLAKYDPQLVRRAAMYLFLKETHSSFEVERVKATSTRAQRFANLLKEAELGRPLSEERLVALQNAVVEDRRAEASYRLSQNWLGEDYGYRRVVDFVPPRPEDVRPLMDGLIAMSERLRSRPDAIDPVVATSAIAFGFVFIHPFMDGNGRLHRYLIHEHLATADFTPKGVILPVSAVILANLDRYRAALEQFSKPINARSEYNPDAPAVPATGNDPVYFRYFDATEQACFLYDALERTVEHDLDEEISFLLGFDRARKTLEGVIDWPPHSLDLFIRVVKQNNFKMSATKHASHFDWMTLEEVGRFERAVERAFSKEVDLDDILIA